ncbi:MAG TPA: ATP-dependent DNA helicase RecG [Candidatus Sulfotelmatobacter sp.]|nr:ATP-dependent DNA helicase RecG [Candidatus Sulfotelmatobacter sp.]
MDLQTPVAQASKSYKLYAKRLEKLGIFKLEDFLFHIPFRYEDFSIISKIEQIQAGETVTVKGKVEDIKNVYTRRFKTLQSATISDETGTLNLMWFNQPFLIKVIKKGDLISVSGKVELDKNKFILISPNYEVIFDGNTIHTGRLVPVYPETRGISSKWLRRQIFKLLEEKNQIKEYLPKEFLNKNSLIELGNAIEEIHFPKNMEEEKKARERLSFDELFQVQLSSLVRKKEWNKEKIKTPWVFGKYKEKIEKLIKSLPFELTSAQKNAIEEIFKDFQKEKAMNRLLEGDVGSGKTVVAEISIYLAFLNGFQSAFMAPTEILANQHYKTLSDLLNPFGLKIELLTGASKLKNENFDVLIGTHALIYKKATFKKLGFVVIDEQQRFGVEQRSIIRKKGDNPHLLTMTATPIPRTVALTMYGDLDLSVLDEMPKERLKIKTWLVSPSKRTDAYNWIEKKVKEGDQVFIVCPFIEESETLVSVKAATKEFERLKKEVFTNLSLGLMHGKMKSEEKNKILKDFKDKKIDILVSTPVVEVGIDISNATIMLIEEAERFGLAQLHQLRGRVGRGNKQSYCLLFTQSKNPQTLERIKSLETIYSGALLSELDLKLRGSGQIYGTIQHGVPQLKVANFSDFELIEKTKKEAKEIFEEIDKYPLILEKVKEINKVQVSPD